MPEFNVSKFASQIGKKGLASPNKLRVAFTMPSGVGTPVGTRSREPYRHQRR